MPIDLTKDSMPLEEALAEDGETGILARLAASKAHEKLMALISGERDRGVDVCDLSIALGTYFVQMHSALSAQIFEQDQGPAAAHAFKQLVEQEYAAHFRRTLVFLGRTH